MTATWNGSNGLTLTAKTAGGGTDYSFTAGSGSNNPSHFNPPSFSASASGGGNLTGGRDSAPAVYDTGSIWVTVNGCQATASYGQGDDPSSVAAKLAAAVNGSCAAWATASSGGTAVSLTAARTGSDTDYPLSTGASTSQPGNFGGPSFAVTNLGANLAGGSNGTTVYDTGTAWVTVNGCQGLANYGQGDTPSTVATSIAAALNATCSSWVTASANGAAVGLTAAQSGGDTDYSLSSGSSTNQPGNFSQASFSVGASGGSLVSGSNPTSYSYSLTYAPDGNVTAASDSVNGNWTYSYDDFNRLVGSSCSANCPDGQSAQAFSYVYDRYANRWQQNVTAGSGPQPTATFNNTKNQLDGYSYDPDGNLLNDGAHWYTYDAESRIIAVDGGSVATYVYDAQGRRVQKTTASGAVYYVYAITGEQVAEVNSSGSVNREEVYAGGKHLATYTNNTTYFNHADWLGTERMRTTVSASSCETIRSLAFGDGEATTGSCSDASPMHFTGKERDSESGLDNFGARYNASTMGRFMTPDPLLNSGRPWNPQTWNRYSYARNNPLSIVDPTGLYDLNNTCASDDKKCNKQFQQHANDLKKGLENLQKKVDKMKDGTEKTRLGNSLKALGTEGDHNGVNVAFGATKDGSAATTDPIFDQSSGKYSGFNVTIDPSKESNGANGWAIDAAHEGTHVSDYENFELNPATSMQPFQIEYRGYQTSAWAAQALGFDNISYRGIQIWNSSWGAVDRQTLQDRGITNVVNDANHPEVQPHNPFPNQ